MRRMFSILILLLAVHHNGHGQNASVSTNLVGYADFLTLNADASWGVSRHWSLGAGFMYNPWKFKGEWGPARNERRTVHADARYWLWNVYSGWWIGTRVQWEEYSRGGIRTPKTEEGDAWGAGASAGYSLMLHRNLNLDFGMGLWGGWKRYTVYRCPACGRIEEKGSKAFVMPSDVAVSLMFTF